MFPGYPVPMIRVAPENILFPVSERVYGVLFCTVGTANCRRTSRRTVPVSLAVQEELSQYPVWVWSPRKVTGKFGPPVARNIPVRYPPLKVAPVIYIPLQPLPEIFPSASVNLCSKFSFLFPSSSMFFVVMLDPRELPTNTTIPVMRIAEMVIPIRSSMRVKPFFVCRL